MKHYRGERTIDGLQVTVDGTPLPERTDIAALSDTGFEWTYEGTAPTQLALALLADHLANDASARAKHAAFMRAVVANFGNEWEMTSADIDAALETIESEG
jgi:hypothetical protein